MAIQGQHKVRTECGDVLLGTRQVTGCPSTPVVDLGLAVGYRERERTDNKAEQPGM